MPTIRLVTRFANAIIGSGPLVSEEDRQIQRIMDVKEPHLEGTENSWLTPDVQVVFWFVLLCCLVEGIVSGFHWWRTPTRLVVERTRAGEKNGLGGLERVDEDEDEDDEANIPVL
ncbi:hypothetical protein SVAN01_07379 [Stagonosporopsis vannaccii]|nr:hypothetical protein SVAN01_07379 [Stagonosporopsis vannaccii]